MNEPGISRYPYSTDEMIARAKEQGALVVSSAETPIQEDTTAYAESESMTSEPTPEELRDFVVHLMNYDSQEDWREFQLQLQDISYDLLTEIFGSEVKYFIKNSDLKNEGTNFLESLTKKTPLGQAVDTFTNTLFSKFITIRSEHENKDALMLQFEEKFRQRLTVLVIQFVKELENRKNKVADFTAAAEYTAEQLLSHENLQALVDFLAAEDNWRIRSNFNAELLDEITRLIKVHLNKDENISAQFFTEDTSENKLLSVFMGGIASGEYDQACENLITQYLDAKVFSVKDKTQFANDLKDKRATLIAAFKKRATQVLEHFVERYIVERAQEWEDHNIPHEDQESLPVNAELRALANNINAFEDRFHRVAQLMTQLRVGQLTPAQAHLFEQNIIHENWEAHIDRLRQLAGELPEEEFRRRMAVFLRNVFRHPDEQQTDVVRNEQVDDFTIQRFINFFLKFDTPIEAVASPTPTAAVTEEQLAASQPDALAEVTEAMADAPSAEDDTEQAEQSNDATDSETTEPVNASTHLEQLGQNINIFQDRLYQVVQHLGRARMQGLTAEQIALFEPRRLNTNWEGQLAYVRLIAATGNVEVFRARMADFLQKVLRFEREFGDDTTATPRVGRTTINRIINLFLQFDASQATTEPAVTATAEQLAATQQTETVARDETSVEAGADLTTTDDTNIDSAEWQAPRSITQETPTEELANVEEDLRLAFDEYLDRLLELNGEPVTAQLQREIANQVLPDLQAYLEVLPLVAATSIEEAEERINLVSDIVMLVGQAQVPIEFAVNLNAIDQLIVDNFDMIAGPIPEPSPEMLADELTALEDATHEQLDILGTSSNIDDYFRATVYNAVVPHLNYVMELTHRVGAADQVQADRILAIVTEAIVLLTQVQMPLEIRLLEAIPETAVDEVELTEEKASDQPEVQEEQAESVPEETAAPITLTEEQETEVTAATQASASENMPIHEQHSSTCSNCGMPLPRADMPICPHCGTFLESAPSADGIRIISTETVGASTEASPETRDTEPVQVTSFAYDATANTLTFNGEAETYPVATVLEILTTEDHPQKTTEGTDQVITLQDKSGVEHKYRVTFADAFKISRQVNNKGI